MLQLVHRLAEKVDIPDPRNLSLHSIRHSAATALLQADEPLDVVQALLGHADPRTTQAYLHVDQLERSPAHRADARLAARLARHSRHDAAASAAASQPTKSSAPPSPTTAKHKTGA